MVWAAQIWGRVSGGLVKRHGTIGLALGQGRAGRIGPLVAETLASAQHGRRRGRPDRLSTRRRIARKRAMHVLLHRYVQATIYRDSQP